MKEAETSKLMQVKDRVLALLLTQIVWGLFKLTLHYLHQHLRWQ